MSEEAYCRLCAMKAEKIIDIYGEEGENFNIATKIVQCLQIWLYQEDVLPKTVCTNCFSKVNEFYDFFQVCSQSQISLMAIFKDKQEGGKEVMAEEFQVINEQSLADDSNSDLREDTTEYHDLTEPGVPKIVLENSFTSIATEENEVTLESNISCREDQESATEERRCRKSKQAPRIDLDFVNESLLLECIEESEEEEEEEDEGEEKDEPKQMGRGLEGYMWKCIDCNQEVKTLAELRRHHTEVHNQAPVFACVDCSKTYTRYRSFARHVKTHIDPKKFSCDVCGKCFSQKTVLESHKTVHSGERPHICAECGKTFKQWSSLHLHSKSHLPAQVKPKFVCTVCSKEFATKHTLEMHMKLHTGERNFVCDICGKRFVAKGSLDYHMMSHNETKPFPCSVCSKSFKTMRLLGKHSTVHSGIKPHQCDVCGKQFRERGALREHNRIHTGAMPYSCDYCGKLFRFKGILTVHKRLHTGERPYKCNECRRDFTNWANYNKHVKRRHNRPETHALTFEPSLTPAPPPAPAYKVVEDEMYRVSNFMPYMNYIPPLHQASVQLSTPTQ